ncbi:MAG: hydantoinase B/oxoprolinase family protein [Pseudomonadota bacterium]
MTGAASPAALDPVTLAVLSGRLERIADEMDATLYRSAFNPIIAEAHDACHGLYHRDTGATLVQGTSGLPIFVGAMAFAVKAVIDAFPRETFAPGQTYLFNDPYSGGTHLNDFRLIRPVFVDGALFCFLASVGHWLDIGGNVAGGFNPRAVDSCQEGVRIPPVLFADRTRIRQDIVAILSANSRTPDANWGDLNGQLNALDLGEARFAELIGEMGAGTVEAAFGALTSRAEAMMRAHIAALPDGRYSVEDKLDGDGVDDHPLTVALDMTVSGGRLRLDFSRTDPACRGPLNIARATAVAAVYVALKHVFTDVPANSGVLAPIDIEIAEGSLLAAEAPRPVGGYTETVLRVIDTVFSAIGEADPARAQGNPYATINALSLTGERETAEGRRRWVMFCFFGGGLGASSFGDGLSHGNNPISTAVIPPAEILEAAYPVVFRQWALREGSGGDGEHRGGLGAIYEIETLTAAEVSLLGERGRFPPKGAAGGGPAAQNKFTIQSAAGWYAPPAVSKVTGVALEAGQGVRIESPGGGGWGDPHKRSVERRERDLALGFTHP